MSKPAFSLVELLIVVLIMGLVYTLSVTNFKTIGKKTDQQVSLLNLVDVLDSLSSGDEKKLICTNNCKSCKVYIGSKIYDTDIFNSFLDDSVRSYYYSYENALSKYPTNDCFYFSVDENSIPVQIVVYFQDKYYDFRDYINGVKVYNSKREFLDEQDRLNRVAQK